MGLMFTVSTPLIAQESVLEAVKTSLQTGKKLPLTRQFNPKAEIIIEGKSFGIGLDKAKAGLTNLFKNYPPTGFRFIHKGSPKGGFSYAIGRYSYKPKPSGTDTSRKEQYLKAYLILHFENNKFLLESIEFNKEENKP